MHSIDPAGIEFLKQWGRLVVLSFLAAAVQMYLSRKTFTFFHYFMNVLVAIFAAYSAAALCEWREFNSDLTTGIIALVAYTSPSILDGLTKFVQFIAQNPKEFLSTFLKVK